MFLRKSAFSLPLVAAALMLIIGSLSSVASFTAAPTKVAPTQHAAPISPTTLPRQRQLHSIGSTTALGMNFSPPGDSDTGGLRAGVPILVIAMLVNVWMFSIPTEFRRARLCSEEDVKLHPEAHCTTFAAWRTGIAEYYANGGGVEFNFDVEGKE
mmetsp:Transcript_22364/g.54171  ORF Transcript_22364/g.54171 Transcript_22364/m.54171 type:complete len:155 (-) Transcript_22364:274-738(-)